MVGLMSNLFYDNTAYLEYLSKFNIPKYEEYRRTKKMNLKSMRELDMIRGKMLVNKATQEELHDFLRYVNVLEDLVEEASDQDFYGTEGWQHSIGLE